MAKKKITPVCFWCGKDMPEMDKPDGVKIPKESIPPHRMIINYQPCESCADLFRHGIHVYSIDYKPVMEGQLPIGTDEGRNVYPTGQYFLAPKEWIRQVFPDDCEEIFKKNTLALHADMVEKIIDTAKKVEDEKEISDDLDVD